MDDDRHPPAPSDEGATDRAPGPEQREFARVLGRLLARRWHHDRRGSAGPESTTAPPDNHAERDA